MAGASDQPDAGHQAAPPPFIGRPDIAGFEIFEVRVSRWPQALLFPVVGQFSLAEDHGGGGSGALGSAWRQGVLHIP